MKLSVLTENTASGNYTAEHGLSFFIEYDNKKIIFDTGHSDVFLKNAKKLNIDINTADAVVLSHGHWDHGNGLKYLTNKKLICHPNCFIKRYRKNENIHIGLNMNYSELKKQFEILTSKTPYYISEKIIFLGEIPRLNSFESQTTNYVDENRNDDFIIDDSALAINNNDELIVVSGCSHSGICNIIEYAKKVTKLNKVKAVIGGFHLQVNNHQTKKTIQYFKDQKIQKIYPSHCTKFPALVAFYNEFKITQVTTGMTINF